MNIGSPKRAQLVVAAVVTAIALTIAAVVLLQPKQRLAGSSSVAAASFPGKLQGNSDLCLQKLLVPADSAAFRVQAVPRAGRPASAVMTLSRAGIVVARAEQIVKRAGEVVFPLPRQSRTTGGNRLCLHVRSGTLLVAGATQVGVALGPTVTVRDRPRKLAIKYEFLRPDKETGLGLIGAVFHRASLFKAGWMGAWTFYVYLVLFLAIVAAAVGVLIRSTRRPPGTGMVAAVTGIAFLSVGAWTIVSPAFQPPDEVTHYAYVESIAQRGAAPCTTPGCGQGSFTPGELLAANYTAVGIVLRREAKPPWTALQEDEWRASDNRLGERGTSMGGGYTNSAGYFPAYYVAEAPAYIVGKGGSVFDRLWLMRLLSALMAAGSVLFITLFVRELAPGVFWAPPAAGLAVAFHPMFGFVSGSINNDSLLILSASAELYLLARVLHRGLTVRLGLAVGAVLALGIAAKPTMYGLLPAVAFTLVWVAYRDRVRGHDQAKRTAVALGAAAGCFAVLMLARYQLVHHEGDAEAVASHGGRGNLRFLVSYLWQWYLPRLPFMKELFFFGDVPFYVVFFHGFWAHFGHVDTLFPPLVYKCLLMLCATGLVLAVVAVARRGDWGRTIPKLLLGVTAAVGIALAVHARAYLAYVENGNVFAQGRYLLPAIGVLGGAVALASLAFGRRRGAVAATSIVVAMAFFDLFSMGLTLERFYT